MQPPTEPKTVSGERRYEPPVLREYGTVASVTAAANKTGVLKDGGPNNSKT